MKRALLSAVFLFLSPFSAQAQVTEVSNHCLKELKGDVGRCVDLACHVGRYYAQYDQNKTAAAVYLINLPGEYCLYRHGGEVAGQYTDYLISHRDRSRIEKVLKEEFVAWEKNSGTKASKSMPDFGMASRVHKKIASIVGQKNVRQFEIDTSLPEDKKQMESLLHYPGKSNIILESPTEADIKDQIKQRKTNATFLRLAADNYKRYPKMTHLKEEAIQRRKDDKRFARVLKHIVNHYYFMVDDKEQALAFLKSIGQEALLKHRILPSYTEMYQTKSDAIPAKGAPLTEEEKQAILFLKSLKLNSANSGKRFASKEEKFKHDYKILRNNKRMERYRKLVMGGINAARNVWALEKQGIGRESAQMKKALAAYKGYAAALYRQWSYKAAKDPLSERTMAYLDKKLWTGLMVSADKISYVSSEHKAQFEQAYALVEREYTRALRRYVALVEKENPVTLTSAEKDKTIKQRAQRQALLDSFSNQQEVQLEKEKPQRKILPKVKKGKTKYGVSEEEFLKARDVALWGTTNLRRLNEAIAAGDDNAKIRRMIKEVEQKYKPAISKYYKYKNMKMPYDPMTERGIGFYDQHMWTSFLVEYKNKAKEFSGDKKFQEKLAYYQEQYDASMERYKKIDKKGSWSFLSFFGF